MNVLARVVNEYNDRFNRKNFKKFSKKFCSFNLKILFIKWIYQN